MIFTWSDTWAQRIWTCDVDMNWCVHHDDHCVFDPWWEGWIFGLSYSIYILKRLSERATLLAVLHVLCPHLFLYTTDSRVVHYVFLGHGSQSEPFAMSAFGLLNSPLNRSRATSRHPAASLNDFRADCISSSCFSLWLGCAAVLCPCCSNSIQMHKGRFREMSLLSLLNTRKRTIAGTPS